MYSVFSHFQLITRQSINSLHLPKIQKSVLITYFTVVPEITHPNWGLNTNSEANKYYNFICWRRKFWFGLNVVPNKLNFNWSLRTLSRLQDCFQSISLNRRITKRDGSFMEVIQLHANFATHPSKLVLFGQIVSQKTMLTSDIASTKRSSTINAMSTAKVAIHGMKYGISEEL